MPRRRTAEPRRLPPENGGKVVLRRGLRQSPRASIIQTDDEHVIPGSLHHDRISIEEESLRTRERKRNHPGLFLPAIDEQQGVGEQQGSPLVRRDHPEQTAGMTPLACEPPARGENGPVRGTHQTPMLRPRQHDGVTGEHRVQRKLRAPSARRRPAPTHRTSSRSTTQQPARRILHERRRVFLQPSRPDIVKPARECSGGQQGPAGLGTDKTVGAVLERATAVVLSSDHLAGPTGLPEVHEPRPGRRWQPRSRVSADRLRGRSTPEDSPVVSEAARWRRRDDTGEPVVHDCPAGMVEIPGGTYSLGERNPATAADYGHHRPRDDDAARRFLHRSRPLPGRAGDDWPQDGLTWDQVTAGGPAAPLRPAPVLGLQLMLAAAGPENWRLPYNPSTHEDGICDIEGNTPSMAPTPDCLALGVRDFMVRSSWATFDPFAYGAVRLMGQRLPRRRRLRDLQGYRGARHLLCSEQLRDPLLRSWRSRLHDRWDPDLRRDRCTRGRTRRCVGLAHDQPRTGPQPRRLDRGPHCRRGSLIPVR